MLLDIWSVGVILLCIVSKRFPFFQSNDDMDALVELAEIFGLEKIQHVANLCGRSFETNIPYLPKISLGERMDWKSFLTKFDGVDEVVGGDDVLDILSWCLTLNPRARHSASRILLKSPILQKDGRDLSGQIPSKPTN